MEAGPHQQIIQTPLVTLTPRGMLFLLVAHLFLVESFYLRCDNIKEYVSTNSTILVNSDPDTTHFTAKL